MDPTSEINEVHTAFLGNEYLKISSYLKDPSPQKRKSYKPYLGSVIELDDARKSVSFQSECLLPQETNTRLRVLLLFSNAHPLSIKNGMFHTAESGVADLWSDLCETGFFSAEHHILKDPDLLRTYCLNLGYSSKFAFGFSCYWIFPTFHPNHLRHLFGKNYEPEGFQNPKERLDNLLLAWKPQALISFNGQVYEKMTGLSTQGYTTLLPQKILKGECRGENTSCQIFQTFPAGWRYDKKAIQLRRESLRKIFNFILECH